MFSLGILTISTSGHEGKREDTSGLAIRKLLSEPAFGEKRYEVVADKRDVIEDRFRTWADREGLDLIVSTGGTGLSPSDVTPEACLAVVDRLVPGMAETMRAETLSKTPMAMLSRSVVGIRGRTLIVTLPGSPKAVVECLEVILPVLPHALEILKDKTKDHPVGH